MHQDLKIAVIPGHLDEQGFSGKTFLRFCASFFVAWLNPFAVRKFYKIGSSSKCLEKERPGGLEPY